MSSSRTRSIKRAILTGIVVCTAPLGAASAQDAAPATPSAPPNAASLAQLKAAAYDAQQKAAEAQAESDRAKQQLEAHKQAAAAPPPAPAVAVAPTPVAASAPAPPAVPNEKLEALERSVEAAQADAKAAQAEAEAARAAADQARQDLDAYKHKEEMRFARNGLVIGAMAAWAPDMFDTAFDTEPGQALSAMLGYRVHERFEISLQTDRVSNFDFEGYGVKGNVSGWTATANVRVFLLTHSFQPFLGVGLGAFYAKAEVRDGSGNTDEQSEVAGVFKLDAGFDYYLSERLALTADAAIYLPGGELSSLTFATLGGGLKLRF